MSELRQSEVSAWRAEHFDASVIAQTIAPLYTEAPNSTHPFVARMQPVNPVDLVEHVLREAEKQIAEEKP